MLLFYYLIDGFPSNFVSLAYPQATSFISSNRHTSEVRRGLEEFGEAQRFMVRTPEAELEEM